MANLRLAPVTGLLGHVGDSVCTPCAPDNPTIPKGARTFNHVFGFTAEQGKGRRMLAWRIKGEEVGNHFHPRAPNKDPEMFEFLYGDIDLVLEDLYGDVVTHEIRIQLGGAPVYATVPPYVLHKFFILSEHGCFEEFQEGPFDPNVNFSADEFYALKESLALA